MILYRCCLRLKCLLMRKYCTVLHAINNLLASQKISHNGDGYHGADTRALQDFDIGQFAIGLCECIENLAGFTLVITGLWHDLVVSLVEYVEDGDAVLFVEAYFVLAGQPADGGADRFRVEHGFALQVLEREFALFIERPPDDAGEISDLFLIHSRNVLVIFREADDGPEGGEGTIEAEGAELVVELGQRGAFQVEFAHGGDDVAHGVQASGLLRPLGHRGDG